jgi:hypothetical protein
VVSHTSLMRSDETPMLLPLRSARLLTPAAPASGAVHRRGDGGEPAGAVLDRGDRRFRLGARNLVGTGDQHLHGLRRALDGRDLRIEARGLEEAPVDRRVRDPMH